MALVYVLLSVLVLGVLNVFTRSCPDGLAAAIAARLDTLPRDEIIVLADPSHVRVAFFKA